VSYVTVVHAAPTVELPENPETQNQPGGERTPITYADFLVGYPTVRGYCD